MFLNLFLFYQVVRPFGRKSVDKYLYLYLYLYKTVECVLPVEGWTWGSKTTGAGESTALTDWENWRTPEDACQCMNFVMLFAIMLEGLVVLAISPVSSDRQHLSYDVCLEVRGEIIRTVLCCIVYWSCAQS